MSTAAASIYNVQNPALTSQPADLEKGIKQGNLSLVKNLVSNSNLNEPLPSGELPLHLAVRANQPEIAAFLLERGAEPVLRDYQNLSAIDHAFLMNDNPMISLVLSKKIGGDLKTIQDKIQMNGSATSVQNLGKTMREFAVVDSKALPSVHQFAFQGNSESLEKSATNKNVNDLDARGLAPIHYAVLGNKAHLIDRLIELGANPRLTAPNGDSLLHFAATFGTRDTFDKILSLKLDVNQINKSGDTALHYAAARENLFGMEKLVKAGANPNIQNRNGLSPLAVLGVISHGRDPLSIPIMQKALFASVLLFWATNLAYSAGMITDPTQALGMIIASAVAIDFTEFCATYADLKQNWKKGLALAGWLFLADIPGVSTAFAAWRTYILGCSTMKALKNCWNNAGFRKWDAAKSAVVHTANTAHSTFKLYALSLPIIEAFKEEFYLYKISTAKTPQELRDAEDAYASFMNRNHQGAGSALKDANECPNVVPKDLANLSNRERLMKPELDPSCPEHALMIMDPNYTLDQLRNQGESLWKKRYRNMMLRDAHTDKLGSDSKLASERLNNAQDTLKKWYKENVGSSNIDTESGIGDVETEID